MAKRGRMLRNYESMVILTPTFNEDDAKKENEKIQNFIKENGGEILNTDEWGKKRFAYQIAKFDEGIYFVNYYKFDTEKLTKLENYLKLNESIIRYNLLITE